MKNFKLGFIGVFALAMMMLTSCTDECKDVTCLNGGTCLAGTCECPAGYEGTDCGEGYNAKFVGNYSLATTACDTVGLTPYSASITASATDAASITVGGLYENPTGTTVTATVSSGNTSVANIESQIFADNATSDQLTMTGTVTVDASGSLSVNYTLFNVTQNFEWDSCTDTFTKN